MMQCQRLSHYSIADALGLGRQTIWRFLEAEHFPERCDSGEAVDVVEKLPFSAENGESFRLVGIRVGS
jgi:hypothetical protein